MRKTSVLSVACLLAVFSLAPFAHAESLATRVPADAVAFAEWAGSDNLGNSYDTSNLKKLLDVLNVPQLISQKMEDDLKAADPQKAADAKLGQDVLNTITHSPTAVYFGPMDFANPQEPQIRLAIFAKVGQAKAADLAVRLTSANERNTKKHPPTTAVAVGDFILVNVGVETDIAKRLAAANAPAGNLAEQTAFKETLAQVDAAPGATTPPATLLYANAESLVKILEDAVAAKGDPRGMFPKVEDAFHLDAFHQFALAGRFNTTGNWTDNAFVSLSAQREGVAAFFDQKPLTDEDLKLIPKSATYASVTRIDFSRILDDLTNLAGKVDPNRGQQNLDMAFRQFFAFTGVDLKADILNNLNDTYVLYTSPDAAGNSLRGLTLVTRVKDGPKIDAALNTLEQTIGAMIAQRDPNSAVQFKTSQLPAPNDKITVHELTLEKLTPAWAVSGDKLYLAASATAIQSAVEGNKGTILENPQFAGLLKELGHQNQIGSFSYIDLQKLAAELYPFASEALSKDLAAHPDRKNPFVLPPLDKITPLLSPALSIHWSDKDGFHSKATGPLPMSTVLASRAAALALIRNVQMQQARRREAEMAPK